MVLKNITWLFKQRLRITDTVGRYGGEEFGIILPETSLEDAANIINELLESVRKMELCAHDEKLNISFSAGIVAYPDFETVDDLCVYSDKSMYEAKRAGRNQVLAQHGNADKSSVSF